jgi:hypothetical protein
VSKETVTIPLLIASAADFDQNLFEMPYKPGGGNREQTYSDATGRFVRKEQVSGTPVIADAEFYDAQPAKIAVPGIESNFKITPDLAGRVTLLKAQARIQSDDSIDLHEHMSLVGKRISELNSDQMAWAIQANDPDETEFVWTPEIEATLRQEGFNVARLKQAWGSGTKLQG